MWKEKLGNYLIDISKYVITGVVISSLFKDFDDKTVMYIIGILFAIVVLSSGLILTNNKKKETGGK